jgi:hypothetical protein
MGLAHAGTCVCNAPVISPAPASGTRAARARRMEPASLRSAPILATLALALVACGGTTLEVGDASTDGAPDDAAKSDGAIDAGPFACGKEICQGSQFCIHPCCGGPPPQCLPLPEDGGKCPDGFQPANCPSGPGCQQKPCTPAPPYCAPTKEPCRTPTNGRDVFCICA